MSLPKKTVGACFVRKGLTLQLLKFGWLAVLVILEIANAQKHPVSVADCVSLRKIIDGPVMSNDGSELAFVVKSPDVEANVNRYSLRIRTLRPLREKDNGRVLLSSTEELSGLHFVNGGTEVIVLINSNRNYRRAARIETVALAGGVVGQPLIESAGITGYSVSKDGNTIAYISPVAPSASDAPFLAPDLISRGFHVPDEYFNTLLWSKGNIAVGKYTLWIARRDGNSGSWRKSQISPPADAKLPGSNSDRFQYAYNLGLSPDGRYLAFAYTILSSGERWMESRTVKAYRDEFDVKPVGVALYEIKARRYLEVPALPFPDSGIDWSADSSSFSVYSAAPVGSKWDRADTAAHTLPRQSESFHLFAVNVVTKQVSEILRPDEAADLPSIVSWKRAGEGLLIELNRGNVGARQMVLEGDEWKEERSLPELSGLNLTSSATTDGRLFVGIRENSKHPPDLWFVDSVAMGEATQLTDLNPSVSSFELGDLEDIRWKNKYGGSLEGKLILPPSYQSGTRYPLVIMLTWPDESFVCDGHYTTAFPPQPLASAGFAVAIFNVYDAFVNGPNQPSGPPQTKEAESMVVSVESLIDFLAQRGTIQRDNVGIIGFSRSSWKVDYFLTHSSFPMKAASSADGGLGNYGNLWTTGDKSVGEETAKSYGGYFVGASRSEWLAGAPAFNADKVETPLLMEYTGGEGRSDQPLGAYEFHSALVSLGKPVELFFYPHGSHPIDTPFERVASLQRNVDWFRFWMQGREGIPPEYDPDQFLRWRKLRESGNDAAGSRRR